MIQTNIQVGSVSNLLYDLLTSTKAKKFRAGFIKVNGEYRVGKFDLLNRSTWKQIDGTMYKQIGIASGTRMGRKSCGTELYRK